MANNSSKLKSFSKKPCVAISKRSIKYKHRKHHRAANCIKFQIYLYLVLIAEWRVWLSISLWLARRKGMRWGDSDLSKCWEGSRPGHLAAVCLWGWVLLMSLIRPPMKFSADHQASAPPPIDYHHHISRVLLPVLILLPLYITQGREMISFPSR